MKLSSPGSRLGLIPLFLSAAALCLLQAGPASAQTSLDVARRHLLCAQLGFDFADPLGEVMFQRCLQQGPVANLPRPVGAIPQLVKPVGPLVTPLRQSAPSRPGDGCRQGFVWREATPGDHVCVSPATRRQAWADNGLAASRINLADHSYGPDTCQGGFVWRETIPGDHVCVLPEVRAEARIDNAAAADRIAP